MILKNLPPDVRPRAAREPSLPGQSSTEQSKTSSTSPSETQRFLLNANPLKIQVAIFANFVAAKGAILYTSRACKPFGENRCRGKSVRCSALLALIFFRIFWIGVSKP